MFCISFLSQLLQLPWISWLSTPTMRDKGREWWLVRVSRPRPSKNLWHHGCLIWHGDHRESEKHGVVWFWHKVPPISGFLLDFLEFDQIRIHPMHFLFWSQHRHEIANTHSTAQTCHTEKQNHHHFCSYVDSSAGYWFLRFKKPFDMKAVQSAALYSTSISV